MKLINWLLTSVLGNKNEFSFEDRFTLACISYAGLVCFISIFINSSMGLGAGAVIIVSSSFLIYSFSYLAGRFFRKIGWAKLIFSIYTIFFCNFYWLTNYGSRGAALYLFLVYFSMILFMLDNNKYILIIAIVLMINIIGLFLIEVSKPNIIPQYPSEWSRISDTYVSLLIYLGIFSILAFSAKSNYIRQYKKAQKSDTLKSAFLANMSHEVRTPLNVIVGFSKLLSRSQLDPEKKELYTKYINDNSKYLLQLVTDILDVSMIESGQLKLTIEKVNLNELFHKLYNTYSQMMAETSKTGVALKLDIPEGDVFVTTDVIRLEQIMNNIINNAIKFTQIGYIRYGYYAEDKNMIFYVEDTGRGIKEEFQPDIFNRFVKNEDDIESKFARGTGIGLALTRDLVQMLGGKIWFTSQYQEGSIFYFSLPKHQKIKSGNFQIY